MEFSMGLLTGGLWKKLLLLELLRSVEIELTLWILFVSFFWPSSGRIRPFELLVVESGDLSLLPVPDLLKNLSLVFVGENASNY
jgi:hypothetical protein